MEVAVQDYRRIRNALGAGIVDNLLKNVKEKERMKAEVEKEKRKNQRRNNRDTR